MLRFSFFTLVSLPYLVVGQVTISGTIQDRTGNGIPLANVLLLDAVDSTLTRGSAADLDGNYSIEQVDPGAYLFSVSVVGFMPHFEPLTIEKNAPDLIHMPMVQLSEDVPLLQEAQVVAIKPLFEREADRMIVNVSSAATSVGSTALDILQRSPGVQVDKQSDNLSMLGKTGVIVMINGKQSRLPMDAIVQMLEGMNADNIEKIELITTPPSSFDAEGNAGVINIVLKEQVEEGTNGNLSVSAGHNLKGEILAGSFNLNHRGNKLDYFVDYSTRSDRNEGTWDNLRTLSHPNYIESVTSLSVRNPHTITQNVRSGLSLELNKKFSIELLATGFKRNWQMDALTTGLNQASPDSSLYTIMDLTETNIWKSAGLNIGTGYEIAKDHQISFDYDLLWYNNHNPSTYNNQVSFNQELPSASVIDVSKTTPILFHVAKLDYTRQLNESLGIEGGIKGTLSNFVNDVEVQLENATEVRIDSILSSYATLNEYIAAVYGLARLAPKGKWKYSAGLRYELTDSYLSSKTEQGLIDQHFGNFFPTVTASYALKESSSLSAAYNRRISRPSFRDMAPFVFFAGPNTFIAGNPGLLPAIADALDISYQIKSFFVSVKFSKTSNWIGWLQPYVDPTTNDQYMRSENIDQVNEIAISMSYPWHIAKWWDFTMNANGNFQAFTLSGSQGVPDSKATNFGLSGANTFLLPKDYTFEISGWYNSGGIRGIWIAKPMGALNLAVKKTMDKNGSTITLALNDVFKTIKWNFTADLPQINAAIRSKGELNQRSIVLTYSRQFGNNKLKSVKIEAGGAEERKRVD